MYMRMLFKIIAAATAASVIAALLSAYRPVIDAGHGGFDGGAVAADGTTESSLNLAVASKLNCILLLLGEEPVMLRSDDSALGEGETIRAAKSADMKARVRIADETEDGFIISIHQNSFGDSRYGGAQVFWSREEARPLAELLQFTLRTALDPSNERAVKKVSEDLYLFRKTMRPAVLVECGFLTNTHDLELLRSNTYQMKLACAIAACFVRFNS